MGKQRREQSQDSIFVDNPFVDGFLEWMGVNRHSIGTPDRHSKGTPLSYVLND
jgi:hypothetical protein